MTAIRIGHQRGIREIRRELGHFWDKRDTRRQIWKSAQKRPKWLNWTTHGMLPRYSPSAKMASQRGHALLTLHKPFKPVRPRFQHGAGDSSPGNGATNVPKGPSRPLSENEPLSQWTQMIQSRIDPRMTQLTQTARNAGRCRRNAPQTVRMGRLTIRLQSSGLRQARHCQSSSATETRQSPASSHHPIIIRFSGRNHPIGCTSLTMGRRRKSADNRASFPPESSDAPAETVRNRQANQPHRQIRPATPVVQRSGDFPVPSVAGWKTRPPVIEVEATEMDKALKEILEKLGV